MRSRRRRSPEARGYGREVPREAGAGREDLRALPLVTIDGEDARDFDDAVYAEPNASGFRLVVAIADVSHYVRPGTALDTEARAARDVGVLPEPRAADAAGGAVESPLLADAGRRPPVHGRGHAGHARRARSRRAASTPR